MSDDLMGDLVIESRTEERHKQNKVRFGEHDAKFHYCEYPVGSIEDSKDCGKAVKKGSKYCPTHHKRMPIWPQDSNKGGRK